MTKNILILLINFLIIFLISFKSFAYNKKDMFFEKLKEVIEVVDLNYVQDIDYDRALNNTVQAFLNSFDNFSQYYSNENQVADFISLQEGEKTNLGIQFVYDVYQDSQDQKKQVLKIISVVENSIAHKSSLEIGDFIVAINDKNIENFANINEISKEIQKGNSGSKISFLIKKDKIDNPIKIDLKKELINDSTIESRVEFISGGAVCYIKIVHFNKKTFIDLKKQIKTLTAKLKAQNKKILALILDLRNNPGGLLEQAIAVSEYFLKKGIIVKIKNRSEEKIYHVDEKSEKFLDIPIVVLINSYSASASEIVAAALQENKRALLVGTTSFGKATVQKLLNINQNSAIKITTSLYYTPKGKSIDKQGILPDVVVEQKEVLINDENTQKTDNSFESKKVDYQYKRALDLVLSMLFLKQN